MISHKHECIFIHIPKCAGTSIESALGHFEGKEKRWCQDHRTIRMLQNDIVSKDILSNKRNMLEVAMRYKDKYSRKHTNPNNLIRVTNEQFDSYYKFAVVRNPYDRALSWYGNVMRDPQTKLAMKIADGMPFDAFLEMQVGQRQLRPQLDWLVNFKGDIAVDKIVKFENIQNDFTEVLKNLKNADDIILPHRLKGEKSTASDLFTDKSESLIKKHFGKELDLFEYELV